MFNKQIMSKNKPKLKLKTYKKTQTNSDKIKKVIKFWLLKLKNKNIIKIKKFNKLNISITYFLKKIHTIIIFIIICIVLFAKRF